MQSYSQPNQFLASIFAGLKPPPERYPVFNSSIQAVGTQGVPQNVWQGLAAGLGQAGQDYLAKRADQQRKTQQIQALQRLGIDPQQAQAMIDAGIDPSSIAATFLKSRMEKDQQETEQARKDFEEHGKEIGSQDVQKKHREMKDTARLADQADLAYNAIKNGQPIPEGLDPRSIKSAQDRREAELKSKELKKKIDAPVNKPKTLDQIRAEAKARRQGEAEGAPPKEPKHKPLPQQEFSGTLTAIRGIKIPKVEKGGDPSKSLEETNLKLDKVEGVIEARFERGEMTSTQYQALKSAITDSRRRINNPLSGV